MTATISTTAAATHPYFVAVYDPFGKIYDDFDSTGIDVGNPNENGIVWTVPFRFPGQYADPELNEGAFYNWHRYYMPEIGRYNRADTLLDTYVLPQLKKECSAVNLVKQEEHNEEDQEEVFGERKSFDLFNGPHSSASF